MESKYVDSQNVPNMRRPWNRAVHGPRWMTMTEAWGEYIQQLLRNRPTCSGPMDVYKHLADDSLLFEVDFPFHPERSRCDACSVWHSEHVSCAALNWELCQVPQLRDWAYDEELNEFFPLLGSQTWDCYRQSQYSDGLADAAAQYVGDDWEPCKSMSEGDETADEDFTKAIKKPAARKRKLDEEDPGSQPNARDEASSGDEGGRRARKPPLVRRPTRLEVPQNVADSAAQHPPVKRGRGRPRKYPLPQAGTQAPGEPSAQGAAGSAQPSQQGLAGAQGQAPPKRGRGRPRKYPIV